MDNQNFENEIQFFKNEKHSQCEKTLACISLMLLMFIAASNSLFLYAAASASEKVEKVDNLANEAQQILPQAKQVLSTILLLSNVLNKTVVEQSIKKLFDLESDVHQLLQMAKKLEKKIGIEI